MNKVQGRIAKFKVNPGIYNFYDLSTAHYYDVHIFESPKAMYEYARRVVADIENHQNEWGALTSPVWRICFENDEEMVRPKIGNILLWKGQLSVTVVCHEAVHAATCFLRLSQKLKLTDQIDENEEMLAHCIGSLSTQIYNKIYAHGIL
jgi:hypothetical protein